MTRRDALRLGMVSSALVQLPISIARADGAAASAQFVDLRKDLYPGPGLPGAGQLDIRMSFDFIGTGTHEDVLEVQRRMKPFNPESCVGARHRACVTPRRSEKRPYANRPRDIAEGL